MAGEFGGEALSGGLKNPAKNGSSCSAVEVEEVGGYCVYLVGREGAGFIEWLRPADVAPEGSGVLPEAADCPDGLVGGQRAAAADEEAVLRVLTLLAVA